MNVPLVAVMVAAAISLKAPLEDAARSFVAGNPGEPIKFTFGSCGQLEARIEDGLPADLFLSASPVEIDRLAAVKRIDTATRVTIAGNRLVVVVPRGVQPPVAVSGLADPRFRRVAIGNIKHVPAGRYAREALAASGVLDVVSKRFVYGANVRDVLDLVAHRLADVGFVYATELPLRIDAIDLAFELPENLHSPILYEGALLAGAKGSARAGAFLHFLTSSAGHASFVARGFLAPQTQP